MSLTHFNKKNKNTEMVDISNKNKSQRIAIAKGEMIINKSLYDYLLKNKKITNNLFNTSKISGVLAAKNTSNVIPLTHNIPIDYIDIKIELKNNTKINIIAEAKSHYSTGIEIEVIHAVAVTATTLYDMLKSYKKTIIIKNIQLVKKTGGSTRL
ncbi:cyclic pyranopterin monophosphate synthase MoaC [Alphaproteobacteria bacterium]|nr:cyclic pyranopterin monophosphate synthase MoaC [Alphaproteobacteria bacterium]MDB9825322.1 cyclic pyranopterin monophosphate synthase MoaC [Alphaproteobacteria bacterium]